MKSLYRTLSAATVMTVGFDVDAVKVEVVNRDASADVFFTVDGTTPTVNGNNTYLAKAATSRTVDAQGTRNVTVKLISSGTPAVGIIVE